jgi:hypothetical protein
MANWLRRFAFPPAVRRHREPAQPVSQDHLDTRAIPKRRFSHQTDLAGPAQRHGRLEPHSQGVARGDEPVYGTLRRAIHSGGTRQPMNG